MTVRPGLGLATFLWAAAAGCSSYYVRPGLEPALPDPGDLLRGRLILAGDAGEVRAPSDPEAAATEWNFEAMRGDAAREPGLTTVVWLGDNVYPRGLPVKPASGAGVPPCGARSGEPTREQAESVLRRQIRAAGSARIAVFVPGNHDWDRSGDCGYARVLAQEQFVETATPDAGDAWPASVRLLPDGGCPGPAHLDLPEARPAFRLIALNTEWLLRDVGRDGKPVQECAVGLGLPATATEEAVRQAFLQRLTQIVRESPLPAILVSHHPLETHGHHGGAGWTGIQARLFPTSQDIRGRKNRRMVREIHEAIAAVETPPPVVAVAGHDHDLQALELGRAIRHQLVSGAASKVTPVGNAGDTLLKYAGRGYMRIDFIERRGARMARLGAIGVDAGGGHLLFSAWLEGSPR
jgi:hypothetical protein